MHHMDRNFVLKNEPNRLTRWRVIIRTILKKRENREPGKSRLKCGNQNFRQIFGDFVFKSKYLCIISISTYIFRIVTHILVKNKLINDPNRPKQPKIGPKIPKISQNLYYGSAEKGYTPLHKNKNILTRKDDEDFWSLAIVQKLNCDSETIIIFFLRF